MTAWCDDRYEEVLRARLRLKPADEPLEPSDRLADLGLDSMGTIQLLLELEDTYAVTLPDEALTVETFATAGSLWSVLSALLAEDTVSEPVR